MLGRLLELVNEWEIQLLVLLSFTLQLFLFFTGSLRQRSKNWLLRGTIWIAYLGADVVAIYALGFLSRHTDATDNHNDDASSSLRLAHPLSFLWAPFLLVHLGGQDTITAYAMEDNNLWLRHLLNLLVQVTLALYVFWKTSSWHSKEGFVPGILLFVAGIIKYGERTVALMHGNLNNMVAIPKRDTGELSIIDRDDHDPFGGGTVHVTSIIYCALSSAPGIRMLFASHSTLQLSSELKVKVNSHGHNSEHRAMFKLIDVELGMMYNDLYTKAAVLRTKCGVVYRCISLTCSIAALILFFFFTRRSDHGNTGGRVDTAITYTLFIGGLVVDICTPLTMLLASPWTWRWLQDRGHRRMARISLSSLSCNMVSGWLGTTRPLWSNTMGQYRFVCYDNDSEPPTLSERVMGIIRKQVGAEGEKKRFWLSKRLEKTLLFWLSKRLETKDVAVDENVTVCLFWAVQDITTYGPLYYGPQQQWRCLGHLLQDASEPELANDFVLLISWLHACTEVLLCEAAAAAATMGISIATGTAAAASADVCRKLSRYMMYLVAAHPAAASLLQLVTSNPEAEFQRWKHHWYARKSLKGQQQQIRTGLLRKELTTTGPSISPPTQLRSSLLPSPERWQETLEELKQMWAKLLLYAAYRSRPEAHAAELLTFVWLLMSHRLSSTDLLLRLFRDCAESFDSQVTLFAFDNIPPRPPSPPIPS